MIRKLELAFIIVGFGVLGTWLFSDRYEAESALATIGMLSIASIYILLTQQGKIYRIFASVSLTVVAVALGTALLRLSGITG